MERKIDAFESELSNYAKLHGKRNGLFLSKRARRDIIFAVRKRKQNIDEFLQELLPVFHKLILAEENRVFDLEKDLKKLH